MRVRGSSGLGVQGLELGDCVENGVQGFMACIILVFLGGAWDLLSTNPPGLFIKWYLQADLDEYALSKCLYCLKDDSQVLRLHV